MSSDVYGEIDVIFDLQLALLLAVSLEVLRETPGVLSGQAIHHVFHFVLPLILSPLYHVLVNFYIVDDALVSVDSGGLIWRKSDLAIHYEVIVVLTLFHILKIQYISKEIMRRIMGLPWISQRQG